jgi:hypothetical protein
MAKFSRVELHKSAEIPASADAVWELLTDWAGMFRWRLTAEAGGAPGPALVACALIGERGAVPRTRRMTLDNGAIIEEEIFYQNDAARRIYYSKNATEDVTGYIASAYVDAIDDGNCTLHIASSFDVSPGADLAAIGARFVAIYEQAIFNGFRRYFARGAASPDLTAELP